MHDHLQQGLKTMNKPKNNFQGSIYLEHFASLFDVSQVHLMIKTAVKQQDNKLHKSFEMI